MQLHAEGREAGSAGRYERALELFEQSARLAPRWPHPVYDAAWTHLLMGDEERAFACYSRVDAMAPRGFFTSKVAVDCVRRELDGRAPRGTYVRLVRAEMATPETVKLEILEGIVRETPDYAAAWLMLANCARDDEARERAIECGLAGLPDVETRGQLLLARALLLRRRGRTEEAAALLAELQSPETTTLVVSAFARQAAARKA